MRPSAPPAQSQSECCGEKINVLALLGIETQFLAQIPDTQVPDGLHMQTKTAILQGNITAIIKEKQQQTYMNK
jgi:hypothetical protein